jgi:hypothetical protein
MYDSLIEEFERISERIVQKIKMMPPAFSFSKNSLNILVNRMIFSLRLRVLNYKKTSDLGYAICIKLIDNQAVLILF